MKIFGSWKELLSVVFRKNSNEVVLKPNDGTTYTATRTIQLPPGDADHALVSADSTSTLTNKSIDGDANTITDLPLSALKTSLADANKALVRDASGVPTSALLTNANIDAAAAISLSKLDNLTEGRVLVSDGSGDISASAVTSTEVGYLSGVTSAIQTQLNTLSSGNSTLTSAVNSLDTRLDTAEPKISSLEAFQVDASIDIGNLEGRVDGLDAQFLGLNDDINDLIDADTAHLADTTAHGTTGNVVGTSDAQTLTNKTISGASNTLTVRLDQTDVTGTLPVSKGGTGQTTANAALNALLPSQASASGKALISNGTDASWGTVSGGSGSGELNAVTNPNLTDDATGWTGGSRVTSGSPLSPVITSAYSIANTAASESSTSGGYYSISTMPTPFRSRKLKVEFWFTTPATDVYRVSVYAGTTRLALSTDSSSVTTLPANTTGRFYASFDATTASAYSLNVTRTSGTAGACVITNVIIGPGENVQGAAVGDWQSYTPTGSWTTNTTYAGKYRRVGDSMEVQVNIDLAGAPTAATLEVSIPSGFTINTSALANTTAARQTLGAGQTIDAGVRGYPLIVNYASTTRVGFRSAETTGAATSDVGSTSPFTYGAGDNVSASFIVPIAEWAGSGTVNLGPGAQIEYAYNSSSTTTTDSTSFAYGPQGVAFQSYAASGVTPIKKRVQFQNPIQSDDVIVLEISPDSGGTWYNASSWEFNYTRNDAGTTAYGTTIGNVSTTQVDVNFFSASTPGIAWSAYGSTYRWRVRKAKASAPVGFGMAADNTSGLVSQEVSGSFTATISGGFSSNPTGTCYYRKVGKNVTLYIPGITGTSNATNAMVLSGLPATITPARLQGVMGVIVNNSSTQLGYYQVKTDGTINLNRFAALDNITGGTTATGTKGSNESTFSYLLD